MDMDTVQVQVQVQVQQDHRDAPPAKRLKLSSHGQPSLQQQQHNKTRPPAALPPTDLQAVDTLTSKQRSHLIRGACRTPISHT